MMMENMLCYINQSNNRIRLNILKKNKKALLILIPDDILIEEELKLTSTP